MNGEKEAELLLMKVEYSFQEYIQLAIMSNGVGVGFKGICVCMNEPTAII